MKLDTIGKNIRKFRLARNYAKKDLAENRFDNKLYWYG